MSFIKDLYHLAFAINIKKHTHKKTQYQEARRTTILQPVEHKPHSQKDRQDEKAEGYVPHEGTR